MKNKLKTVLMAGLTFGLGLSFAGAMQIGPSYHMFTLKPGGSATGQFTLVNTDGEDLAVTVESKDWFLLDVNKDIHATDWLKPKVKKFNLKNGESRIVGFTAMAPPEGAQGELVGMVSFHLKGKTEGELQKVLSAAVYVAIEGTEQLKGDLSAFTVNVGSKSLQVGVGITNLGNVHIRPNGYFKVTDKSGAEVANIFIHQARPTYPGREGTYFGEVKDFDLPAGKYTAHIIMNDIDRRIQVVQVSKKFRVLKNKKVELE